MSWNKQFKRVERRKLKWDRDLKGSRKNSIILIRELNKYNGEAATGPEQIELWTSAVIIQVVHETLAIDAKKILDLLSALSQITDMFRLAPIFLSLDYQVKNQAQTVDQPTFQFISDPVIRFLQTDQELVTLESHQTRDL